MDVAINRIRQRGYELRLYLVTTGTVSSTIRNDTEYKVVQTSTHPQIQFLDAKRIDQIFYDYVYGIAPAVPTLFLRISESGVATTEGVHHRFDPGTKIECGVFSMAAADVGALFKKSGIRLFARNIRGYLGESPEINEAMAHTVKSEPENFWYYNNGVTIVCDEAKREVESGVDVLRVERAQVINGQQTTRTLESTPSRQASVLVKVIRIPRAVGDHARYEDLVSSIVRATNWQNPITPSDLISNDYIQVYLERELRKRGYQYLRKRESKSEARRRADSQIDFQISKFELAQSVAGSEFDPAIVRQGKEALFDERYYRSIFKTESVEFYLKRYWLLRHVGGVAYGRSREFKYAKWLVYNRVFDLTSGAMASKDLSLKFRRACEGSDMRTLTPLRSLIFTVFRAAISFYRKNSGSGKDRTDWPTFVKASNQHTGFATYWRSAEKARAKTVQRRLNIFQTRLSLVDLS
jgi:AIPR protein